MKGKSKEPETVVELEREAEKKLTAPVMCFCAASFRPVFFSMTPLNDCLLCGGKGWVEEHPFTSDEDDGYLLPASCTICGWSRVGHWDYVDNEEEG